MSEMLDQVSAALDKCGQERGCRIPTGMLRHLAAAAVAALREPTDAILKVGGSQLDEDWCSETNALHIWRAMIEEMLR